MIYKRSREYKTFYFSYFQCINFSSVLRNTWIKIKVTGSGMEEEEGSDGSVEGGE